MEIAKQTLTSLKEKHGPLRLHTINLPGGAEAEFVWRRPTLTDWEVRESVGGSGGLEAGNRQFIAACIVHPERAGVMDLLRKFPIVIEQWVEDAAVYLGSGVSVETVDDPDDATRRRSTLTFAKVTGREPFTFSWRQPVHDDWESSVAQARAGTSSAHVAALLAFAVEPGRAELIAALQPYPIAVAWWINRTLLPFFGQGAAMTSVEL